MVRAAALLFAVLFVTHTAIAETKPPGTVAEAKADFEDADDELNEVYKRCVDPEAGTVQSIAALRDAQRTWIEVRDTTARAYQLGQSDRRPQDDEYYIHGQTVMTRSRIEELRTLFDCK